MVQYEKIAKLPTGLGDACNQLYKIALSRVIGGKSSLTSLVDCLKTPVDALSG